MQDNENFENEYDDYEDSYHESKFNNPTLYFLDGDYKITLISEIDINAEDVYCTFHVSRTTNESKTKKSLFDVFTLFEQTFLLEFLMSVLAKRIINIGSIHKIISSEQDNYPCICITATFTTNQKYISIEDEIESDECATDVLTVGKNQMMRTHQYFYTITQSVKYCILKYDVINVSKFDWDLAGVDWYAVYNSLIEPYILFMIGNALKCNINSVVQYSDYMTFTAQFAVNKFGTSFYAEIYILPDTIYHHNIIYNNTDGREILIGTKVDNEISYLTSDQYRIILGSQNLNLLPINVLNTKVTIEGSEPYIVAHELSTKDDPLINYFLLSMDKYTRIPKEFYMYLGGLAGFNGALMDLPIDKDHTVKASINYFSMIHPESKEMTCLKLANDCNAYGVITFALESDIPNNLYITNIGDDEPGNFMPKKFYEMISIAYKCDKNTQFRMLPIRSLPKYREYLLIGITSDSDSKETQTDIIDKNKDEFDEKSKKRRFFKLGKYGD